MIIPNIPHALVVSGTDVSANTKVSEWGEIKKVSFKVREHVEIAQELGILDMPRAAKISGSGFAVFSGVGAALQRALEGTS